MGRSSAYNCFGVLMDTSWPVSCPRWHGLREDALPMRTLCSSQSDFCPTAFFAFENTSFGSASFVFCQENSAKEIVEIGIMR